MRVLLKSLAVAGVALGLAAGEAAAQWAYKPPPTYGWGHAPPRHVYVPPPVIFVPPRPVYVPPPVVFAPRPVHGWGPGPYWGHRPHPHWRRW